MTSSSTSNHLFPGAQYHMPTSGSQGNHLSHEMLLTWAGSVSGVDSVRVDLSMPIVYLVRNIPLVTCSCPAPELSTFC